MGTAFRRHVKPTFDLLELMIKRSSNEMAAKYSQLVGLDNVRHLQRSPKYRLYDETSGGGLWSGKHYGIDEPRVGDPLGDCDSNDPTLGSDADGDGVCDPFDLCLGSALTAKADRRRWRRRESGPTAPCGWRVPASRQCPGCWGRDDRRGSRLPV